MEELQLELEETQRQLDLVKVRSVTSLYESLRLSEGVCCVGLSINGGAPPEMSWIKGKPPISLGCIGVRYL